MILRVIIRTLLLSLGLVGAVIVFTQTVQGQDEQAGVDAPGASEHHEEQRKPLKLSEADMREFGISVVVAGPGSLEFHASFPGEVRLNEDRLAHVVPNIAGVVKEVTAHLGDRIERGDVMAVLASRELAEAKAGHLASHAQLELLEVTFQREKQLWEDKISAEQDYLRARNAVEKARIELRSSEQRLYALGLTKEAIHRSEGESNSELTRFEVRAPFAGTIIEKHITLGEALEANAQVYTVADLSTVWVDLSIYAKDLLLIREGQEVVISTDMGLPDTDGVISYIGPVIGEETRTATARIVLPSTDGLWRPGLFVTAQVSVEDMDIPIKIPKSALQLIEGKAKVFVLGAEGFVAKDVRPGRMDADEVEILAGLEAGQKIVATGAFYLKAELAKEAFAGGGHHH